MKPHYCTETLENQDLVEYWYIPDGQIFTIHLPFSQTRIMNLYNPILILFYGLYAWLCVFTFINSHSRTSSTLSGV